MILEQDQTVREIAIRHPASVRIFEALGIDYCCGGKQPLGQACAKAKVPVSKLIQMLKESESGATKQEEPQWNDAPLAALIAHILETHHRYVRDAAPRLEALLQKVVSRHGEAHPELGRIEVAFQELAEELMGHMMKEERILFPFIEQMEVAASRGTRAPSGCFPSVEFPIARMLAEHADAGAFTAKIRYLSAGYQVPADACPSYRGLYYGLEEFERDLHGHVHLENNILFPRAIERERSLQRARP